MHNTAFQWMIATAIVFTTSVCLADDTLFEDNFDDGLSDKWQIVGLTKEDYRIRDGGLELRVQIGELTRTTPMLKINLPFTTSDTVVASVEVTVLGEFSQPGEMAGIYLSDETGREFGAKKQFVDDALVFAPGRYIFTGEPGEEGDAKKYDVDYTPADDSAGPLRILVDRGYAYFQVGPSAKGKYLNFFHSALRKKSQERGFCLTAAGAPAGAVHWVRFDNFRVFER